MKQRIFNKMRRKQALSQVRQRAKEAPLYSLPRYTRCLMFEQLLGKSSPVSTELEEVEIEETGNKDK